MQVIIGSDHRGFELKEKIKNLLSLNGLTITDLSEEQENPSDDYPDIAERVGKIVVSDTKNRGIVLCGSGVGVDIAANKINGIRCGFALNADQVKAAREDDNINMLAIAADYTTIEDAQTYISVFLQTAYEASDSHQRRIDKITALE